MLMMQMSFRPCSCVYAFLRMQNYHSCSTYDPISKRGIKRQKCPPPKKCHQNKGNIGLYGLLSPETPAAFASLHVGGPVLLVVIFQMQPISSHAARVVVKGDMLAVTGYEAVRHKVPPDPALDAAACSIYGRIFEPTRTIAGPVMRGLRGLWWLRRQSNVVV